MWWAGDDGRRHGLLRVGNPHRVWLPLRTLGARRACVVMFVGLLSEIDTMGSIPARRDKRGAWRPRRIRNSAARWGGAYLAAAGILAVGPEVCPSCFPARYRLRSICRKKAWGAVRMDASSDITGHKPESRRYRCADRGLSLVAPTGVGSAWGRGGSIERLL
jgi:hypothetical protein